MESLRRFGNEAINRDPLRVCIAIGTHMFNPLKTRGNYMYHLLYQSVLPCFVFVAFVWFSAKTGVIFLNSVNQLIFVMVKCGVLFEVRTEFLNNV
jgi:ABC-type transport system involved in cytochrome bd biosynthesis fused ATPase/permease subunit